jgi:hypothetical protein
MRLKQADADPRNQRRADRRRRRVLHRRQRHRRLHSATAGRPRQPGVPLHAQPARMPQTGDRRCGGGGGGDRHDDDCCIAIWCMSAAMHGCACRSSISGLCRSSVPAAPAALVGMQSGGVLLLGGFRVTAASGASTEAGQGEAREQGAGVALRFDSAPEAVRISKQLMKGRTG